MRRMEVFHDIPTLRKYIAAARAGRSVVLVPTMGALHAGHRACIDAALVESDPLVVASIFVNPTQFGPGEDFDAYPRPIDEDVALCRAWGVDVVFAPTPTEMYPESQVAWIDVEGVSEPLCGAARPGHFRGVATVVAKLFNIVLPDVAVFGQKDAQQALVIRAFTRQLDFPVRLKLARTVREPDGLAMSSRNAYLSPEERQRAGAIHRSFVAAGALVKAGERGARTVEKAVRERLNAEGVDDVEYAEVRDARDLSPLDVLEGRVILAVAAKVGSARLIDNVVFEISKRAVEWDVSLY